MATTKLVEDIGKLTVMQLAELVKELEDTFGVSAAAPAAVAVAAPAAGEAEAAEKSEYKVILTESGTEKLKVIKAMRSVTQLSLKEAKDALDQTPFVIAESAPKEDADKMKAELETAGAKVTLS